MTRSDLLRAARAIVAGAAARHAWLARAEVAGIGWATVDLDRAAMELGESVEAGDWAPAPRDELLGASARLRAAGPGAAAPGAGGPGMPPQEDDRAAIILLEPDTEGRLAASLVRFDEGVAAAYVRAKPAAGDRTASWPSGDGPLGHGRLVPGPSRWGPHVIVLDGPAP